MKGFLLVIFNVVVGLFLSSFFSKSIWSFSNKIKVSEICFKIIWKESGGQVEMEHYWPGVATVEAGGGLCLYTF